LWSGGWERLVSGFDGGERVVMLGDRPSCAFVTHGRLEPGGAKGVLDPVGVVALLEECECEATGTPASAFHRRLGELRLHPLRVRGLECIW
jgi:hypothetical protein